MFGQMKRAWIGAVVAAAAPVASSCTELFPDARELPPSGDDIVEDGVELTDYTPSPHLPARAADECEDALQKDGVCQPFRGTFGDRDLFLDDREPITIAFSNFFEQRLQVVFRTDPRLRPSEAPTASLNLEVVLGGETVANGRTFTCAEADPLNIDPDVALDADRIVINKDLHQLQIVYFPPRDGGEVGGLASNFDAAPVCTLTIDEFPQNGVGRFRGTLAATFIGPSGEVTELSNGIFDMVIDER